MIKNITANKFLGAQTHGQVFGEDHKDNELRQLWIQGKADTEGYYTLENSKSQNLKLTAVSEDNLEVKGK